MASVVRTYDEEMKFIKRESPYSWRILQGFVPSMKVEGVVFANENLKGPMLRELRVSCETGLIGGVLLPGVKQVANVAALPGIVGRSIGLPDIHSGYGFATGTVASFDMDDPQSVVCPEGVGCNINCGVRLLRTNLTEKDVHPVKEQLIESIHKELKSGEYSKLGIPYTKEDVEDALRMGIDWSVSKGHAWPEDKDHCEDKGRMINADPSKLGERTKKRVLAQLGKHGAGLHSLEIQVVDKIYDTFAASQMGIEHTGQVVIMIHSGTKGIGYEVVFDAERAMGKALKREPIQVNDPQLLCAKISSQEGQDYLKSMAAVANLAWVNRASMTFLCRQVFAEQFGSTPDDLDMHVIYDVSHNTAKEEQHMVDGNLKKLLVHRKGSSRALPPFHPLNSADYQQTGQPVIIGGTLSTYSYILTGTEKGMRESFGSTRHQAEPCHNDSVCLCHYRSDSARDLKYEQMLERLSEQDIPMRIQYPKLAKVKPFSGFKDVTEVVETCHAAGISRKAVKLRPIAVIDG